MLTPDRLLDEGGGGRDVGTLLGLSGTAEEGDLDFYDIQTTRDRAIARGRCDGVSVLLAGSTTPVQVHFVVYRVGFMVMRLTICPKRQDDRAGDGVAELQRFNDAMWGSTALEWRFQYADNTSSALSATVRAAMDMLFFELHERAMNRPVDRDQIGSDVASGWKATYDRHSALRSAGEIVSRFPVSFGTHYELAWTSRAPRPEEIDASARLAAGWHDLRTSLAVDDVESGLQWYIGENQTVLVLLRPGASATPPGSDVGALDSLRMQTVEYLTVQRAALRAVQRETIKAILEDRGVSRRDVAHWDRLVAGVSDPYVLHDRVGAIIGPLYQHYREAPHLRDPAELRDQVQRNIGSFATELGAANDRAGVLLGAFFGVVAALALVDPVKRAIEAASTFRFDAAHPWAEVGLDFGLLLITAVVAIVVLRRSGYRRAD